jgi:hypothetical protein
MPGCSLSWPPSLPRTRFATLVLPTTSACASASACRSRSPTHDLAPRCFALPDGGGGRGLHLVSTLTTAWGVEHQRGAKTVWAEVPVDA